MALQYPNSDQAQLFSIPFRFIVHHPLYYWHCTIFR